MGWFSKLMSGDIGGALGDAVGNIESGVRQVASGVKSVGRDIDDAVNQIPGGWATVAALAGVYYSPEIGAYLNAAGEMATEAEIAAAVDSAATQSASATTSSTLQYATDPTSLGTIEASMGTTAAGMSTGAKLAAGLTGGLLGSAAVSSLTGSGSGDVPAVQQVQAPTLSLVAPTMQNSAATLDVAANDVAQRLTRGRTSTILTGGRGEDESQLVTSQVLLGGRAA